MKKTVIYLLAILSLALQPAELWSQAGQQQNIWRRITGYVKDSNGDPIMGATIIPEGVAVRTGVVSSSDGSYHITLKEPTKALTFNFIGMRPVR